MESIRVHSMLFRKLENRIEPRCRRAMGRLVLLLALLGCLRTTSAEDAPTVLRVRTPTASQPHLTRRTRYRSSFRPSSFFVLVLSSSFRTPTSTVACRTDSLYPSPTLISSHPPPVAETGGADHLHVVHRQEREARAAASRLVCGGHHRHLLRLRHGLHGRDAPGREGRVRQARDQRDGGAPRLGELWKVRKRRRVCACMGCCCMAACVCKPRHGREALSSLAWRSTILARSLHEWGYCLPSHW